jgi:hypothetical protein
MATSRITAIGFTAAAAALALTACGQASEDGAGSLMQAPQPVRVVSAPGGATAEGRLSSDAAISAMPAFMGFTYEAGPDLPALPTNSTGYQYALGATVDAARVAELAAALGVEGEPVPGGGAEVDGLSWRVGPDDGSAPMLTVGADPQLNVNYSQAWADVASVGCAVAVEGGTGAATDVVTEAPDASPTETTTIDPTPEPAIPVEPPTTCVEAEPPANVPTADEAEALAGDVLDAIGLDPADFEFETYADEWAASVTAWNQLDGVRSPIAWGFGFGENAELQWMNGTLATPVATGPYPLIGLDEALDRLEEQNGWMGRGGVLMDDVAVGADPASSGAVESPVEATVPNESAPQPGETTPPDSLPVVEPLPVETVPVDSVPVDSVPVDSAPVEVPTEVATLVDVRADLWWAWDDDGSVWLLPAYTFTDTEGRVFTVPAVTDEFLIIADPVLVDPMPLPTPVDPPVDVVEPDTSTIIGIGVDDATKTLEGQGFTLRVVIEDGEALAVTEDFSSSRVNVEVADGVVVAVVSIG